MEQRPTGLPLHFVFRGLQSDGPYGTWGTNREYILHKSYLLPVPVWQWIVITNFRDVF